MTALQTRNDLPLPQAQDTGENPLGPTVETVAASSYVKPIADRRFKAPKVQTYSDGQWEGFKSSGPVVDHDAEWASFKESGPVYAPPAAQPDLQHFSSPSMEELNAGRPLEPKPPMVAPENPEGETHEDMIDRTFGIRRGLFGLSFNRPGTEATSPPPTGLGGKVYEAGRQGFQAIVPQVAGAVSTVLTPFANAGSDTAREIQRLTADMHAYASENAALNTAPVDPNAPTTVGSVIEEAVVGAAGALPGLLTQFMAARAFGGMAGFVAGAGVLGAGGQFNESYAEYRKAGFSEDGAATNAMANGLIAGTVSAVTNLIPGLAYGYGKDALGKLAQKSGSKLIAKYLGPSGVQAVRAVGVKAIAKAGSVGALKGMAAEGVQEAAENIGTDLVVTWRQLNQAEFDQKFKENPEWFKDILVRGWKAGLAGAIMGGGPGATAGVGKHLSRPVGPEVAPHTVVQGEAALRSAAIERAATDGEPPLRGPATSLEMTDEQARNAVENMVAIEPMVKEAAKDDVEHRRRIGEALDLGKFTDAQLGKLWANGNTGETAKFLGGHAPDLDVSVTPEMAADEIARRRDGRASRVATGAMLGVGDDGKVSDEDLADWMAKNPEAVEYARTATSLPRKRLVKWTNRTGPWNTEAFRSELHKRIKAAKPAVDPRAATAAEIASEITGLPPAQAELVLRGLSPKTAAAVEAVRSGATPMPQAEPTESAYDTIAEVNGLKPGQVREVETTNLKVKEFAEQRGVKVKFFESDEDVPTQGITSDGTVYLNSALPTERQMFAVAAHEVLDDIHTSDPELWTGLETELERVAPEAMKAIRERYQARLQEGATTDLRREGVSNMAEAMIDAFSLHLAIDGRGNFDKEKMREMVGMNPGLMAKLARIVDRILRSMGTLGILNRAQTARLADFAGRDIKELKSPAIRAFIAQSLGTTLNRVAEARGADVQANPSVAQSVGKNQTRPSPDDPQTVADATFSDGVVIGNRLVATNSLVGGVRSTDVKEGARVVALAKKMSGDGGYIARLVVDENMNVLEGQHRLEAARSLGIKTLPVVVVGERLSGMDRPAMLAAANGAGVYGDRAVGLVRNAADAIRESGSVKSALADMEFPSGFEDAYRSVIAASNYKPSIAQSVDPVSSWAKDKFGDKVAPNGSKAWQNFVKWFGKSKVVDADGKPMRVYHGTRALFSNIFKPNHNKKEQVGFGVSFTPDSEFAQSYATDINTRRSGKGEPRIYEVYLHIQNPLELDHMARDGSVEFSLARKMMGDKQLSRIARKDESGVLVVWMQTAVDSVSPAVAEKAIVGAGYDGVVYTAEKFSRGLGVKNNLKKARTYVAFSPTQIKSATGNDGNFDGAEPSIAQSIDPKKPDKPKKPKPTDEEKVLRRAARAERREQGRMKAALASKTIGELTRKMLGIRDRMAKGREQSRIDLSHAIGRHEGQLAGEIEGQKKGRVEGERVTKKEIKSLLDEAAEAVKQLPTAWQGKYTKRMAAATTKNRMLRVIDSVAKDLAMIPVEQMRGAVARSMKTEAKRIRRRKLTAETAKQVKDLHDAAMAMLSGASGRRLKFTNPADLARRVSIASQLIADARGLSSDERAGVRESKAERQERIIEDAGNIASTLSAKPSIKGGTPEKGAKANLWRRAVNQMGYDPHTLEVDLGRGYASIMAGLRAGKGQAKLLTDTIGDAKLRLLKAAGYDGNEDYAEKAQAGYGDSAATKVKVTLGGKSMHITLDGAMALYAMDGETRPKIIEVGFTFGGNKNAPRIKPTAKELDAIRKAIGEKNAKLVDDYKAAVEAGIQKPLFDKHFELNGASPKKVEGYFRTRRHGDGVADMAKMLSGKESASSYMARSAPMLEERTGSGNAFVVDGFMATMDRTVDDAAKFINLAGPTRHAMNVLLSENVRNEITRTMGDKVNDDLRNRVLHGVGAVANADAGPIGTIGHLRAGAKILLSPLTWVRMESGSFGAAAEMPAGSWAAGVARAAKLSPKKHGELLKRIRRENGYFGERGDQSFVGIVAGYAGEPSASDKARVKAAVNGAMASIKNLGIDEDGVRTWDRLKKDASSSAVNAWRLLRSVEFIMHKIDGRIIVRSYLGHLAHIEKNNPGLSPDQQHKLALAAAEHTHRTSQNVSDPLDDTTFTVNSKAKGGIGQLMFPFSSDPLKGYNQAVRAGLVPWAYVPGVPLRKKARVAAALTGKATFSALVNPVAVGAAAVIGSMLGGGDDDEEIQAVIDQALLDAESDRAAWKMASEIAPNQAAFVGMFIGGLAEQMARTGGRIDVSSNILALDGFNDTANAAARGDTWKAIAGASELVGIPEASAVNTLLSVKNRASQGLDKAHEVLSRKDAAGLTTKKEREVLARIKDRLEAKYEEERKTGKFTTNFGLRKFQAEQRRDKRKANQDAMDAKEKK